MEQRMMLRMLRMRGWTRRVLERKKRKYCTEFTEFFWTFSIVLYSKKHDVSEI
jgi:hypothetical protein